MGHTKKVKKVIIYHFTSFYIYHFTSFWSQNISFLFKSNSFEIFVNAKSLDSLIIAGVSGKQ